MVDGPTQLAADQINLYLAHLWTQTFVLVFCYFVKKPGVDQTMHRRMGKLVRDLARKAALSLSQLTEPFPMLRAGCRDPRCDWPERE